MVSLETLENISPVNFFSPYDTTPLSVQMQRPGSMANRMVEDEPPPSAPPIELLRPIDGRNPIDSFMDDSGPVSGQMTHRPHSMDFPLPPNVGSDPWQPQTVLEPWILDDDIAEDSARVLKSSMFPYSGAKRVRIENFQPDPVFTPSKRQAPSSPTVNLDCDVGMGKLARCLSTTNMILLQMTANDWESFFAVHGGNSADSGDEQRIRSVFDSYLEQWATNALGPWVLFAKDRIGTRPPSMFANAPPGSAIMNSGGGPPQILAGFLKFSLQHDTGLDDGHPCLHIRLSLLPQYRNQRRVMYEAIHAGLDWVLKGRDLFAQYESFYIPYEISASRQNSIAMGGDNDPAPILISSDMNESAQQQMILVYRSDFHEVMSRLVSQLSSPEMVQQVINADIYSTRSEKNMFEMVVKWEIPLLKIDDSGAIHLFMSTYHDTPVETTMLAPLPDGSYKMRLDLCAVGGGAIEACCRIKTKDVIPSQTTISFSGVRKAKVGDKSKLYVIRSQLLRADDKKHITIVDSCLSSVCQLTSSRRVYRAGDDPQTRMSTPPPALTVPAPIFPINDSQMSWRSTSPFLPRFLESCHIYWKAGYPHWLFTQEKVVLEVMDMQLNESAAMKVQLVDVQSNLPVHLVSVSQGAKTTAPILVSFPNDDRSWCIDLRVNSKKEVMNRMSYLLVSLHKIDNGNLHADSIAEFASTFVINVGTTYANLRRRPSSS
jgi:hypothetical protein